MLVGKGGGNLYARTGGKLSQPCAQMGAGLVTVSTRENSCRRRIAVGGELNTIKRIKRKNSTWREFRKEQGKKHEEL